MQRTRHLAEYVSRLGVDGDHLKFVPSGGRLYAIQDRQFVEAIRAPRCPKRDHDCLPTKVSEQDGVVFQCDTNVGGRYLALNRSSVGTWRDDGLKRKEKCCPAHVTG